MHQESASLQSQALSCAFLLFHMYDYIRFLVKKRQSIFTSIFYGLRYTYHFSFSVIKLVNFLFRIVVFQINTDKTSAKKMASPLKSKFRVIKFQNTIDENNKSI